MNKDVTIDAILKAEKWLRDAEKVISEAKSIDAKPLINVEMRRKKIRAEILSKSKELLKLRQERTNLIEKLRKA